MALHRFQSNVDRSFPLNRRLGRKAFEFKCEGLSIRNRGAMLTVGSFQRLAYVSIAADADILIIFESLRTQWSPLLMLLQDSSTSKGTH
jgi:hypothetical protein